MRLLLLIFPLFAFAGPPCESLDSYIFDNKYRTDGLLIWQNGKILFEKYQNGYKRDRIHRGWSMTKTVGAVLVGIAEKKGLVHRHDLINKYLGFEKDRLEGLKLSHFLQMTSGFDFKEKYDWSPFNSSVVEMLFLRKEEMGRYVLDHKRKYPAGSRSYYSSGDSNVVSLVLKKALKKDYLEFPFIELYKKIGMKNTVIEMDASDTYVLSSYIFAPMSDYLQFAKLLLAKGSWNGTEIYTKDYAQWMASNNLSAKGAEGSKRPYGAGVWLNNPSPLTGQPNWYQDAPKDMFMALGHEGQFIAIFPSQNAIAIRLADEGTNHLDRNEAFKRIMTCLK